MIEIAEYDKEAMRLAVEKTAQKLSEVLPEWPTLIDWDRFNFTDYCTCIRGQLETDHCRLLPEIATLGGFNVPRDIQKKYYVVNTPTLWDFMEAEWRKFKSA